MKKIVNFTLAVILSLSPLFAQVTSKGLPNSFSSVMQKSSEQVKTLALRKINTQKQLRRDEQDNIHNRYSIYKKVSIDLKKDGTLSTINSGQIWRYQIQAENSFSLAIVFSKYNLPEGASLFIYNPDKTSYRGAFTSLNNKKDGVLALADFPGDVVIIEYFEPFDAGFSGKVIVGSLGCAYKSLESVKLKSTDEIDNININCPEGNIYQTEKHAVAKMSFRDGNSGYFCTGALVNNTRNDGKLFFLTANHCLSTDTVANTLITYFNYEKVGCDGVILQGKTLSGSKLLATNQESDFTLLLLLEKQTADYRTYFAGWNASSVDYSSNGFGIHHPGGEVKKIAVDYDTIKSYSYSISWENSIITKPNTHWLVKFNDGFTKGGSSGSPLFDNNSRVIGQLHGGSGGEDYYGKFSTSWNSGSLVREKLKPHLDPDNTGVRFIDAYYPSDIIPEAFLYTPFTTVCVDEPVLLKDGSAFSVDTWNWSFNPTSVQFLDGTNKNSQSPVVSFNAEGLYEVSLRVTNTNGADNLTRSNYIASGNSLNPTIKSLNNNIICHKLFKELNFIGAGADSFQWNVIRGMEYVIFDTLNQSNNFKLIKNDTTELLVSDEIEIQLIGFQGKCVDTTTQVIQLFVPDNDFIENAIEINYGVNGSYSNFCATVEKNEPNPVAGDCNSQDNWCNCELSDTIIDNSVWFTFIAPESGIVGINVPGFDNQIAIYDAFSAEDIMSGIKSKYTIIAANDDYFGEDKNYSALIKGASVTPNKKYWLQVDGSACGTTGDFTIELYHYNIANMFPSAVPAIKKIEDISIFPNPVSEALNVTFEDIFEGGKLQLISIDGRIALEKQINSTSEVIIDLPNNIASGIYVVRIVNDEKTITKQIVVQKE